MHHAASYGWSFGYVLSVELHDGRRYFCNAIKAQNKHVDKLGFVSLGGTLIKFVIFFVFDPLFEEYGDTTRSEFAIFFITYVCATIIETVFLVRILNKQTD